MTARIAGLVTRAQWGAAAPKKVTPLNGRRMEGVAVHHGAGATPTDHAKCLTTWRAYQRLHMNGEHNDIAYSMGVCRHGYAFEGRTLANQGGANGTSTSNRTYFSVCVIGSGNVAYSPAVTDALEWVITRARTSHNAGLRVRPHSDFAQTACPDTQLRAWTRTVDGKQFTSGAPSPAPEPPKEAPTMLTRLLVSGARAGETRSRDNNSGGEVSLLQRMLNELNAARLTVDGSFGPATEAAVRAYQTRHRLDVDGRVGPATRAHLNAAYAPKPPPTPTPAPPPANPYAGVTDRALLERIATQIGA